MKKQKVFVAMSGGVDSSVAALLLKNKYDLVGCFIKAWYPRTLTCDWKADRQDAMRVCTKLGIPFLTIDAGKEYKEKVVDYMLSEYEAGRTPNPDIMCNKFIKFGVFLNKVKNMGADIVATGHYARLQDGNLLQARDKSKDQTYFLWALNQKQLKDIVFPVGGLLKSEVRKLARGNNLPVAEKKDSTGVCFIGELDFKEFLKQHIKVKKGKVVDFKGSVLGEHDGVGLYTIGQRRGFGGGRKEKQYIVSKDIKKNILIVASKRNEKDFYIKEIEISNLNWIKQKPEVGKLYRGRIRYQQDLQSCRIKKLKNNSAKVVFTKPQRAVSCGQSLVLYNGQKVLGGGIIE